MNQHQSSKYYPLHCTGLALWAILIRPVLHSTRYYYKKHLAGSHARKMEVKKGEDMLSC